MSKLRVGVLLLTAYATPALGDDADPAETAWSLFTTHCTKYLAADTVKDTIAAFAPHQPQLYTTADGALQNGTVVIEEPPIPGTRFFLFHISTTRLDGGVMRNCSLQISGDQIGLDRLSALAQRNAAAVIGDDHIVKGGFVVTDKGPEGAALHFSTPEFPPKLAMQALSSKNFSSLAMQSSAAE